MLYGSLSAGSGGNMFTKMLWMDMDALTYMLIYAQIDDLKKQQKSIPYFMNILKIRN